MAVTALRSSPSCERNQEPIAHVLRDWFAGGVRVLEVGSGTGQHAAYLTAHLDGCVWQPTDVQPDHVTISGWRALAATPERILDAQPLDVLQPAHWTPFAGAFDAAFTANTLHIMPWEAVVALWSGLAETMLEEARFAVYGPFHRDGKPTSDSNARFDEELRSAGTGMGIRDLGEIRALAARHGWLERAHYQMPANNQMLLFQLGNLVAREKA